MSQPSAPGLRPHVLAAKQQLADGRAKLRARHDKGSPGVQVCRAQTELFDTIVQSLFEQTLADLGDAGPDGLRKHVALIPHGGYGRGDVAPFSDVDLMILHTPESFSRVVPLAERLVRDVYDVGLVLGQSVRTVRDACQLAHTDATICTSLVESRFLTGNSDLYEAFVTRFSREAKRNHRALLAAIEKARGEERSQFGDSVYLLEPNVKRSPGTLRGIQLLRWIGFVCYGAADPDTLRLQGQLTREDYDTLQQTREFLLRMRNEMHYHAGKANDQLDRGEQLRLSKLYGYEDREGMLAVEQFMKQYFLRTQAVQGIVGRFREAARGYSRIGRILAPLVSHQFEGDFLIEPQQISVTRRGMAKMNDDMSQIVRLAEIANLYDKQISPHTLERLREPARQMPAVVSVETAERFTSLLNQPARLGELLRNLRDLGVLEKLIPQFEHAKCLLQFNAYHKYTVDEHSLRAVEAATSFAKDTGPLGNVYRQLKRKWLLHFALLLHDLGKGFPEDHSEVGMRIADEVGRRFQLDEPDVETLKFLVHKHLHMSHLAFRRDTSDPALIVRFAVEVGSAEVLEMLFLLTAADFAAVGPGVLNAWKIEVLADLLQRTMPHLSSDDPTLDFDTEVQKRRDEVLGHFTNRDDIEWFQRQVEALPSVYLRTTAPGMLAEDLAQLRPLATNDAIARGRYLPERQATEYHIGTYETITPGVFHKLTGALSSQGLRILSADITTLADGLIFDRFYVEDPDHTEAPPESRVQDVCRALITALKQTDGRLPQFRRLWKSSDQRRHANLTALPTQVRIDNSTSDKATIIDIFAADRMGLLYTISRTLFELGLNVSVAKIGTYLDQVVDVFYVTEQNGAKLEDEQRRKEVRGRVLAEIERLDQEETR
jgi:[protein-PII] uridylyltransferase